MSTAFPADLTEVYTERAGADVAANEWRTSARVARCRVVERTVRAFGSVDTVYVVCTWWTDAAKVNGWDR